MTFEIVMGARPGVWGVQVDGEIIDRIKCNPETQVYFNSGSIEVWDDATRKFVKRGPVALGRKWEDAVSREKAIVEKWFKLNPSAR